MKYEGNVCFEELTQWQLCFLGPQETGDIYLPALSDQQETEANARQLLNSFRLLGPSPECVASFRPFLCLELFELQGQRIDSKSGGGGAQTFVCVQ